MSYFEEDKHDSRRTYRAVSFLAARLKSRLRFRGAHWPQDEAWSGAPGVSASGQRTDDE
jgi:hypothetical protein